MKYVLVVTLIASLFGSSLLAQQLTYSPEARQARLLDQAVAALRKLPPAPIRKAEARVFSVAQPSPGQNQPY